MERKQPHRQKAWVIERLEARGIEVNVYVDALIEAAVKELDIALGMADTPNLDELLTK